MDKMGIFEGYDLSLVATMDETRLDILYTIIRMINTIFNKYLTYVLKKIFRKNLEEIFQCLDIVYYDLFFEQMIQDIDYFVCTFVKEEYIKVSSTVNPAEPKEEDSKMSPQDLTIEFVSYLRAILRKEFYLRTMKKLGYKIDDDFYERNMDIFREISEEFVSYTKEILLETMDTLKLFLLKIFHPDTKPDTLIEIKDSLEKYFDLEDLFGEKCTEIEIYAEQYTQLLMGH